MTSEGRGVGVDEDFVIGELEAEWLKDQDRNVFHRDDIHPANDCGL